MSRIGLGRHSALDDDAGDPLDGLVNLFDVGMILAVAFLIAGLGLTLSAKGDRLEVRSAAPRTHGGVRAEGAGSAARQAPSTSAGATVGGAAGTERTIPNPAGGPRASGRGTPVGQVYRLADGRLVYVKGNHGSQP